LPRRHLPGQDQDRHYNRLRQQHNADTPLPRPHDSFALFCIFARMGTYCYRGRSRRQKPPLSVHTRPPTRAANVSPPWCVIRTLCGENPALFGDDRASDQERRTSARRGMVMRLQRCSCADHRPVASARQLRSSRCERVSKTTGGLRPPLLCCDANVFRRKNDFFDAQTHVFKSGGRQPAVGQQTRLRRSQRDSSQDRREYVRQSPLPSCAAIPRGAYAPRSCAAMRTSAGEKRFLRCTNAHPTKSGGRQPAVGSIAPREQCTANYVPTITTVESRAAGVSPPWFGSALATATVYFRLSAVARYDRFPHHGGLTPPALVLQ
jgi:hypothetical protein